MPNQTQINPSVDQYHFLSGGGEMGELTRAKDWSKTPVGDPGIWPQSLRTIIGVVLNSKFPMFLWWGPELICFYNDAYRPSLGQNGKHPSILGMPAAQAWPEIWAIIKPLIDQVLAGGESIWFEDQLIPIYRNGKMEDVYWTFSYSPVNDESSKVAGVLVTCTETTEKVQIHNRIEQSEIRFRTLADNIPNLAWMAKADGYIYWYNKKWYDYTGTTPEQMEGWGWQSVHDPLKLPTVLDRWNTSIQNGEIFEMVFPIKGADGKFRQFLTRVLPVKDGDGRIYQWFGSNTDITAQKDIQEALKESEQRFRSTVKQAPVGITILRGKEFIVEMANDAYLQLIDRKESELVGRPLFDSLPEVEEAVHSLLDNVIDTGVPYHGNELPIPLNRNGKLDICYFDFLYHPLKDEDGKISGVIVTVTDVSEKVEVRKKIEQNEERLSIIVEASELGTWELNVKTREAKYSKRYLEILGGYREEIKLTHDQLLRHLHPDDMAIREKAFSAALASGYLHFEARLVWNDNSIHWMEGRGKVFYDAKNQPEKLIGTIRDITTEKTHQQELEESEQKFRLLADSIPQHIWTSDTEGNLNYYNQSVFDYSGLSPEEIQKGGWMQIVHPDDREENIRLWIESVATGKDFLFEHRFLRHDGQYRWQLSRAIPQRDASGNIQMWVGTSTDIQDIKEQDQQKDYFISMASHKLKTPITSIKGYVQILQATYQNNDDPFLAKSLGIIDKQVGTLTRLITDLLDVSKIKTGSLLFNKSHFNLYDLIKDITAEIQHIYPVHNFVEPGECNISVYADKEKIGQVLINFLTNAVKYSPGSNKVKVDCVSDGISTTVSVEDYGIGINKSDSDKVFERFYRVAGKNEKTFPGFGIGLFIAAEIISRHNGTIGVKSEPGIGSVFYFTLPLEH